MRADAHNLPTSVHFHVLAWRALVAQQCAGVPESDLTARPGRQDGLAWAQEALNRKSAEVQLHLILSGDANVHQPLATRGNDPLRTNRQIPIRGVHPAQHLRMALGGTSNRIVSGF